MKTASILQLGNLLPNLLQWIDAGEDVLLTQDGRVVARLKPETHPLSQQPVDWHSSPEVCRDRSDETCLSAEQSSSIIAEAAGKW